MKFSKYLRAKLQKKRVKHNVFAQILHFHALYIAICHITKAKIAIYDMKNDDLCGAYFWDNVVVECAEKKPFISRMAKK